jgi:hypothetical protein
MARDRIRTDPWGQRSVFFEGAPRPEFRPGSYRIYGNGYFVSVAYLRALTRQRRAKELEERRARRLANRTRCGLNSGKAGGGRCSKHFTIHILRGRVWGGTKTDDCPVCYDKVLWRLWNEQHIVDAPGYVCWWDRFVQAVGDPDEADKINRFFDNYRRLERDEEVFADGDLNILYWLGRKYRSIVTMQQAKELWGTTAPDASVQFHTEIGRESLQQLDAR